MRDIADYLVGGYADATFPDNLRIFHYGNCPVLKGPITVKVQYNKHGEYLGTTGNISIASGETKRFCLGDYVPYDGIAGNAIIIWLVREGEPAPEPSPEPTPPATTGDIPSAFQPYIVNISGLSASQEVSWKGVPVLIWWGEGSVTLKGPIKIAEQHATKAGEQISWDEYIIEAGQTRTFSNVSGQDMSIYLLEAEAELNYPCPYCDATFDTQEELDEHIRTEHPEVPPVEGKIIGVNINEGRGGISWSPDERHLGYNELSEAGVNTLCSLWLGKEFVNKVHKYGFKVIGAGHGRDFATTYEQADWRTDEGCDYVWLDELISNIGLTESQYNQIRNHCHSKNPNVKVLICEVTSFTLEQVKNWPYCDGIMLQQYPGVYTDPQGRSSQIAWMEDYKRTHPNQTVLAWITMEKTMDGVSPSQVRDDTIIHLNSKIDGIVYFIFRSRGECYWEEAKEAVRGVTGGGPTIPTIPTYPCPHCPAVFDTQAELDAHIASEHPGELPPLVSGIHFMYCVGAHSDFNRVRSSETNLIHQYGHMGRSYLDKALAAGLYVIYDLKPLIHDRLRGKSEGEQWTIWNNSKDEVRNWINEAKDHPATYGYYVLDEPNLIGGGVPLDLQRDIYNFVKSVDPNHIVLMVIAGGPGDLGYASAAIETYDLLLADTYCYGAGAGGLPTLRFVCSSLRTYLDEHGITTPVFFTVQASDGGEAPWKGHVRDQIDIVLQYNLATAGIGLWAWGDGIDGTGDSDRTLQEVKDAWGASTWEPPTPPPPVYTCPHCGATFSTQAELDDHITNEHPGETFTTEDITCSRCGSTLKVTITSISQNNTSQTCPVCDLSGVATGTKIEVIHAEPWPPIAEAVPWYQKYAPHLIIGGGIAAIIAYFTLRK